MMGTPNCTYTTVPVLETSSTFEMQFAREFKSCIGHGTNGRGWKLRGARGIWAVDPERRVGS
jgi:hypothetical protein